MAKCTIDNPYLQSVLDATYRSLSDTTLVGDALHIAALRHIRNEIIRNTNGDQSQIVEIEYEIKKNEPNIVREDRYKLFGEGDSAVYANEQQREAIDKIGEFITKDVDTDNPLNNFFILEGRGGTGKTTIMDRAVQNYDIDNIRYTAASNKAAAVLTISLGEDKSADTIHLISAYLTSGQTSGPHKYKEAIDRLIFNIPDNSVVIVDEVSMLESNLINYLQYVSREREIKFVLMGDSIQLGPVERDTDISTAFTLNVPPDNKALLVQRMRQNEGSPILNITDHIADKIVRADEDATNADGTRKPLGSRNIRLDGFPIGLEDTGLRQNNVQPEKNAGVAFTINMDEFLNEFVKDYRENPAETKIITYNSEKNISKLGIDVNTLNERVSAKLGKNVNNFEVGDLLMGYTSAYEPLGMGMRAHYILNGADYRVESIDSVTSMTLTDLIDGELYPGVKNYLRGNAEFLNINRELGTFRMYTVNLYSITENKRIERPVQVIEPSKAIHMDALREKLQSIQGSFPNNSSMGKAFNNMFTSILPSTGTLRHNYAISMHKSQGSTYRNAYVIDTSASTAGWSRDPSNPNLSQDIIERNNRIASDPYRASNTAMYVATSRPTSKLIILTLPFSYTSKGKTVPYHRFPEFNNQEQDKVTYDAPKTVSLPSISLTELTARGIPTSSPQTASPAPTEAPEPTIGSNGPPIPPTPGIPPDSDTDYGTYNLGEALTERQLNVLNTLISRIDDEAVRNTYRANIVNTTKQNFSIVRDEIDNILKQQTIDNYSEEKISVKDNPAIVGRKYSIGTKLLQKETSTSVTDSIKRVFEKFVNIVVNSLVTKRIILKDSLQFARKKKKEKVEEVLLSDYFTFTNKVEKLLTDKATVITSRDIETKGVLATVEDFFNLPEETVSNLLELTEQQASLLNRLRNFTNNLFTPNLYDVIGTNATKSTFDQDPTSVLKYMAFNTNTKGISGVYDPNITSLMAMSSIGWLIRSGESTTNNTEEDVRGILGLDDSTPLDPILYDMLSDKGKPIQQIMLEIGKPIYRKLGITLKEDVDKDIEIKMIAQLGAQALLALAKADIIELVKVDDIVHPDWNVFVDDNGNPLAPTFVRLKLDANGEPNKPFKALRDMFKNTSGRGTNSAHFLMESLFGINSTQSTPKFSPPKVTTNALKTGSPVSSKVVEGLTKLQNQKWYFNDLTHDLMKAVFEHNGLAYVPVESKLLELKETLRDIAGYNRDIDREPVLLRDGIKGKNISIDHDIDGFIEFYETLINRTKDESGEYLDDPKSVPFFFKYVQWKNGRIGLQSSMFNPQSSKLHRFLIRSQGWDVPVTKGSGTEMENMFLVGIGQAFGKSVDKENFNEILDSVKNLSFLKDYTPEEFQADTKEFYETGNLSDKLKELISKEEAYHSLIGAYEYGKYVATKEGKEFVSNIAVETDAVTQAVMLGFIQGGEFNSDVQRILEATGLVFDTSNDELTDFSGFKSLGRRDNYENMNDTSNEIISSWQSNDVNETREAIQDTILNIWPHLADNPDKLNQKVNASFNAIRDIFRPNENIEEYLFGDLKGKEGRNLFKDPLMRVIYQAGIGGLVRFLASSALVGVRGNKGFISKWANAIKSGNKEDALRYKRIFARVVGHGSLALHNENPRKYRIINLSNTNIDPLSNNPSQQITPEMVNAFKEGIFISYGLAYNLSLSEFKNRLNTYASSVNNGASLLFHAYNFKYTKAINERKASKGFISKKDLIEIEEELKDIKPYFKLPSSDVSENGIYTAGRMINAPFSDSVPIQIRGNNIPIISSSGNTQSSFSVQIGLKEMSDPGVASVVEGTHGTDNSIIMSMFSNNILSIFDAMFSGIGDVLNNTINMNKATYDINNSYSMANSVAESIRNLPTNVKNELLSAEFADYIQNQVDRKLIKSYSFIAKLHNPKGSGIQSGIQSLLSTLDNINPNNVLDHVVKVNSVAIDNGGYVVRQEDNILPQKPEVIDLGPTGGTNILDVLSDKAKSRLKRVDDYINKCRGN